jgi:CRP-like cAMP-binding protein
MKEQTLLPGEILFKEGEMNQKIYFIFKGDIDLYITLKDRNRQQEKVFQVKNE